MNLPTIRLWDPLVRVFHLSLAGVFFSNYFFNEEGDDWHVWLGYYAVAWLVLRLVWGFTGPRSARWSDFWPTVPRLRAHVGALLQRKPFHRLGHSPLGALVMVLMMAMIAGLGFSGWLMTEVDALWGADWPQQIHAWLADALALVVCLHVAAALFESFLVKDNLPLSMLTGRRKPLADKPAD